MDANSDSVPDDQCQFIWWIAKSCQNISLNIQPVRMFIEVWLIPIRISQISQYIIFVRNLPSNRSQLEW